MADVELPLAVEDSSTLAALLSPGRAPLAWHPVPAQPALVLTVDMGDGLSVNLEAYEGDDPFTLALDFCATHGLPRGVVSPLAERLAAATAPRGQTPQPSRQPRAASVRAQPARPSSVASGERMHAAAVGAAARRERAVLAARAAREQQALSACQPGPVITALARSLPRTQPAWQRLNALADGARTAEREKLYASLRRQAAERELEACTFAPAVTARSGALMEARHAAMREAGVDAHATLYADAQRRAARQEEYRNWVPEGATFAPHLLQTTDGAASGQAADVVARLQAAGERAAASARAAAEAARLREGGTGRRLFLPAVGRGPLEGRPPAPVHEQLYARRGERQERCAQLAQAQVQALEADALQALPGERSAALAEARRRRRFTHIFRALDTRREGVVRLWDAATEALQRLHPEIAADVQAVAASSGLDSADERQFCELMEETVRCSHAGPRGYLGASVAGTRQEQEPQPSFAPDIGARSRALAQQRRPQNMPLHTAFALEAAAAEERRRASASARQAEELADCTFAPRLVGLPPPSAGQQGQAAGPVLHHRPRMPPLPADAAAPRAPPAAVHRTAKFERQLHLQLDQLLVQATVATRAERLEEEALEGSD